MPKLVERCQQHFSLRKLSVGVVAVLLGVGLYFSSAQTVSAADNSPEQSQQNLTNGEMPAKQTTNSGQGAEQETSSDQAVTAQEKMAATTTETNVATNVHLSLVDTDKKETLPADNKGWTNQEYRLSLKGSFDVEVKQLLDGQSVKIAQIETSSSNGQFYELYA